MSTISRSNKIQPITSFKTKRTDLQKKEKDASIIDSWFYIKWCANICQQKMPVSHVTVLSPNSHLQAGMTGYLLDNLFPSKLCAWDSATLGIDVFFKLGDSGLWDSLIQMFEVCSLLLLMFKTHWPLPFAALSPDLSKDLIFVEFHTRSHHTYDIMPHVISMTSKCASEPTYNDIWQVQTYTSSEWLCAFRTTAHHESTCDDMHFHSLRKFMDVNSIRLISPMLMGLAFQSLIWYAFCKRVIRC